MSSGTPEYVKRQPTRWPDHEVARAALEEWLNGPSDAALYATDVDFRGADLTDVDIYYLFAVACDFSSTTLVRADFAGAYLADTNFSAANMLEISLPHAAVPHAVFDRAVLIGANLRNLGAQHASFVDADLSGANVEGYFSGCDFSRAQLCGTRLDAIMSGATVTDMDVAGAAGQIYGPLHVADASGDLILRGREAEEWLSARGASIVVRDFDATDES